MRTANPAGTEKSPTPTHAYEVDVIGNENRRQQAIKPLELSRQTTPSLERSKLNWSVIDLNRIIFMRDLHETR